MGVDADKRLTIITVGGSTTGKTALAIALQQEIKDSVIVCGDQYQTISGFPIATGAIDVRRCGCAPNRLYEKLVPTSPPLSSDEYGHDLRALSHGWPGPLIIDGLSVEYMPQVPSLVGRVLVVGLKGQKCLRTKMLARLWRAVNAGLVDEVRDGIDELGRDIWLARNSLVISTTLRYLDEGWTLNKLATVMVSDGIIGATYRKENILLGMDGIAWLRSPDLDGQVDEVLALLLQQG